MWDGALIAMNAINAMNGRLLFLNPSLSPFFCRGKEGSLGKLTLLLTGCRLSRKRALGIHTRKAGAGQRGKLSWDEASASSGWCPQVALKLSLRVVPRSDEKVQKDRQWSQLRPSAYVDRGRGSAAGA